MTAADKNQKKKSRSSLYGAGRCPNIFYFVKWVAPMSFGAFGFYMQSVLLHYATYNYVHRHEKMKEYIIPEKWEEYTRKYETVPDPLADAVGPQKVVKLKVLDLVAAFFPGAFVSGTMFLQLLGCCGVGKKEHSSLNIGGQSLQVWTKVFICSGILFIIKGALDAMTTVPDSSGWEVCKDRLTRNGTDDEGLKYMKEEHTLRDMFTLDYHWLSTYHHPLRYCSDMMYSGHTFIVTLFALGCYEMLRVVISVREKPLDKGSQGRVPVKRWHIIIKSLFLTTLAIVAVGEQGVEVYFVLLSRFHYSMDVFVALLVTFLLYTNGAIAVFAKQWELRGPYFFIGKWPPTPPTRDSPDEWKTKEVWGTRGDIYLPICCFPFCCLAGRQHIYSDTDMLNIVRAVCDEKDRKNIEEELNLNEGMSAGEFEALVQFRHDLESGELSEKLLPAPNQQIQVEAFQRNTSRPLIDPLNSSQILPGAKLATTAFHSCNEGNLENANASQAKQKKGFFGSLFGGAAVAAAPTTATQGSSSPRSSQDHFHKCETCGLPEPRDSRFCRKCGPAGTLSPSKKDNNVR